MQVNSSLIFFRCKSFHKSLCLHSKPSQVTSQIFASQLFESQGLVNTSNESVGPKRKQSNNHQIIIIICFNFQKTFSIATNLFLINNIVSSMIHKYCFWPTLFIQCWTAFFNVAEICACFNFTSTFVYSC